MRRLPASVFGLVLLASSAHAVSPDPKALVVPPEQVAKANELIRQLGSEVYRDRDRAARELQQMGRLALPALSAGVTAAADPEVRTRCERMLPRAEADEMAARVGAFLADAEGKYTHDLPGWKKFHDAAGNDASARALFAAIIKNKDNHELLMATTLSREELGRKVEGRRQQIQLRTNPQIFPGGGYQQIMPDVADVAVLMLAESLTSEDATLFNGLQYHVANFLYQPAGREAVGGGGTFGPAFRRLTLRWLDTRDGPNGVTNAMNIAQNIGLTPADQTRYAGKMLTTVGVHQWNRVNALTVIARNKAVDQLPAIAKLFSDDTLLMKGGQNGVADDILMRDAALAMALTLTDQEAKDYGMDLQPNGNPAAMKFTPTAYRFAGDAKMKSEDKRKAAFKKWEEWATKNLKDGKLKTRS